MTRIWGFTRIVTTGAPAPAATVTVYDLGTLNLSTIYADNLGTPKANPFTADSIGYYFFYTGSRVDLQVSGVGITTYALGDVDPPGFFSLNNLTGDTQFLVSGTAGVDFGIVSSGSTHTFNIPTAGVGIGRGLVTNIAQTFDGVKTFSTPIAPLSGGTGLNASAAANGKLLIGNGTGFTLANLTGTANQVTVTNGAGSITLSIPQSIATTATPVFTGITLTGLIAPGILEITAGGFVGTAVLAPGQLIIGRSGGLPPATAFITAGTNISVVNGDASITISVTGVLNTLNTLTTASQTFAVGTGGADFNISSAGSVHTFNIPDASAANRGLITIGAQTIAGSKTFTGVIGAPLTFNPGTSVSNTAIISGRISTNVTPVSSVAPGPTDLMTYSLAGNTLDTNLKGVRVTVFGTTAANGNVKTITFNFGATSIGLVAAALNAGSWRAVIDIIRTGAATQLLSGEIMSSNTAVAGSACFTATPAATLSGAVTIKCTATSATNADVVQTGMIVEVIG